MIAITGASGQLGRLVIQELLRAVPATEIIAIVRNPEKVEDLAAQGVQVRYADYTMPQSLEKAFSGVKKVLLISSSELGQRVLQHTNVIDAARKMKVSFMAYTSILHADTTALLLGIEHRQTEAYLSDSKIPHAILRNGWYLENHTANISTMLQHGMLLGCAKDGLFSSAIRADYAAAAATVLMSDNHAGKIYELAGDQAYTLTDFASELSKYSGKNVVYNNMLEAEYAQTLKQMGLPENVADMLANSDMGASQNGLFDDSKTLSSLIKRPTTSLSEAIQQVYSM